MVLRGSALAVHIISSLNITIMSTDTHRVITCSKNTSQHPGLLIPKQTHRTMQEVTADRREKEDAKKRKEMKYKTDMERVANFEKNQAQNDANEHTLRVQTARPLVRTRSYADVLRQGSGSDVEMKDATVTMEQPSPFEYAEIEPGNTTDDGMQTAVQDLPKKKYVSFFFSLISQLIRQRRREKRNLPEYVMPSRRKMFQQKISNARVLSLSPAIAG